MDKIKREQKALLKEAKLDKLEKCGIVMTAVSKKQRRREIDRNNRKMLQALQDFKAIQPVSKSQPKSRNNLSQAVVLASRYGGHSYKRAASAILKKADLPSTGLLQSQNSRSSPERDDNID